METFVAFWNAAASVAEVSAHFGKTPNHCRAVASRYRKHGYALKHMPSCDIKRYGSKGGCRCRDLGKMPQKLKSWMTGNSEAARRIGALGGRRDPAHMRRMGQLSPTKFQPGNRLSVKGGQLRGLFKAVEREVCG